MIDEPFLAPSSQAPAYPMSQNSFTHPTPNFPTSPSNSFGNNFIQPNPSIYPPQNGTSYQPYNNGYSTTNQQHTPSPPLGNGNNRMSYHDY